MLLISVDFDARPGRKGKPAEVTGNTTRRTGEDPEHATGQAGGHPYSTATQAFVRGKY